MTDSRKSLARSVVLVLLAMAGGVVGCKTSEPQETEIIVPSAATQAPEYEGDGSIPEQRYVIRMSDGQRDWEVQFPEVATGYEMHIPLDQQKSQGPLDSVQWSSDNLTEADKELLAELRRKRGEIGPDGVNVDGDNAAEPSETEAAGEEDSQKSESGRPQTQGAARRPSSSQKDAKSGPKAESQNGNESTSKKPTQYRPSYLLGIEEVRRLYKAGKYELAMVRVKKLEQAYPGDEQLLSMKGTLWMKLGRESLARKAWERVLQINPDNEQVKEALQRLDTSQ